MIPVAVIGASGYTGLELVKILLNHPDFEIAYLGATEEAGDFASLHPTLAGLIDKKVEKTDAKEIAKRAKLAFLAVPHQAAMTLTKELIALGVKVVDLSADYRLKLETYEKHYTAHTDQENLKHAIYGLSEISGDQIKEASLIANPGCYPTASLLGILPFLELIKESSTVIIDAKSGVSGAGKKCSDTTHFVNINENSFAYNPIAHRHAPEIEEKINQVSQKNLKVLFVPHLLPTTRGMLASIYIETKEEIKEPLRLIMGFYKNNKSIRVRETPPTIKAVNGTHFCDIYAKSSGNTLFISTAIDNLLRGASSSAVANANLMMGFDEYRGLNFVPAVP